MRQWIAKGQITANTPVWREGWADWQVASTAFTVPGAPVLPHPVIAPSKMPSADLSAGLVNRPAADAPPKRAWTQKELTTAISLALLAVVIILGTVMLFMLFGQGQSSESEPPAKATTLLRVVQSGDRC
jgi:hypothetical protein